MFGYSMAAILGEETENTADTVVVEELELISKQRSIYHVTQRISTYILALHVKLQNLNRRVHPYGNHILRGDSQRFYVLIADVAELEIGQRQVHHSLLFHESNDAAGCFHERYIFLHI